ncbi:hypothetical protein [Catenovulum agarivorans]|uniref:hypothetical protein n=1 Tax=Catenovulum agarivorans TaxID=1172192 RepID=UPI0002D7128D|nr:hypothetical protein [Catenovulum agarivorans]
MEKSEYGKWIHTAFAGASFAYFLAVIDKAELIVSSYSLAFSTLLFAIALALNAFFAMLYYGLDGEPDFSEKFAKYWLLVRFNNLAQWSFILAVIGVVYFVIEPVVIIVL